MGNVLDPVDKDSDLSAPAPRLGSGEKLGREDPRARVQGKPNALDHRGEVVRSQRELPARGSEVGAVVADEELEDLLPAKANSAEGIGYSCRGRRRMVRGAGASNKRIKF